MIYRDIISEIIDVPYTDVVKVVLSAPKKDIPRIVLRPILIKKNKAWQSEKIIANSAFHENIPESDLGDFLERLFEKIPYRQIHIITLGHVIAYRMSKNGIFNRTKTTNKNTVKPSLQHDSVKNYILAEGMPVLPLVDLGVFTQDFHVVKAKYNKYRQINSFLKNIDSNLSPDIGGPLRIIEFGCGKSYLTFILYYYFTFIKKTDVHISGYDRNRETIDLCRNVARKYGYANLEFIEGDISKVALYNGHVDMMITLHACDTATDHALYYALKNKVKYIFSVPCCQQEVNAQIRRTDEYALLLRYGLYKERFSALLTDCIRCEVLNNSGYSVDVVEFVGEENTPKNAMIRARFTGNRKNYENALRQVVSQFGIEHTLLKLIDSNGKDHSSGFRGEHD